MSRSPLRRWLKAIAVACERLLNSPSTGRTFQKLLRMKTASPLALGFLLITTAFSRDFLPQTWFEDVSASDDSIQKCYVFPTLPGVLYTVETSHDMLDWTAVDEVYGLGSEHVVSMYEYTPPPPAPPGSGAPLPHPPPARHVSLCIQPCSGVEGGTLVSWASLDNGQAIKKRLAQALTVNWQTQPFFWHRYGNFNFTIQNPKPAAPAPEVDPELGALDAAMFAQLASSFPTINQSIDDNHIRARNQPPPAPVDPNSRKFWRIHCNWGVDSDGDGSPDWAEFEIAEREAANQQAAMLGDAFEADADQNGVPDGEQLDVDQDGVPDAQDPDKAGGIGNGQDGRLVIWKRPPGFQFAAFVLPDLTGEITDLSENGTVLALDTASATYTLVDKNFQKHSYPRGQIGLSDPVGKFCSVTNALIGDSAFGARAIANAGGAGIVQEISVWDPVAGTYSAYSSFGYDDQIQDERRGIRVESNRTANNELQTTRGPLTGTDENTANWAVLEANGNIITNKGYWRHDPQATTYGAKVALPEDAGAGSATLTRTIQAATPEAPSTTHTWNLVLGASSLLISKDNGPFEKSAVTWKENQPRIGITKDGWVATETEVWNYDRWTPIKKHLGGISAQNLKLKKLLDTGIGLADFEVLSASGKKSYLLFPFSVDGFAFSSLDTEISSLGVDRISALATGGQGRVEGFWVMAPSGDSRLVRLRSIASPDNSIQLVSNTHVKFTPEILNAGDQSISIEGLSTSTVDSPIAIKRNGAHSAANSPLRVKVMKHRTVKVAAHKVIGLDSQNAPVNPKCFPSEKDMEDALNRIYGKQTNTFFDVTLHEEKGPTLGGIDYDFSNNTNDLKLSASTTDPETIAATPNAKSEGDQATANIDVWVIGGVKLFRGGEQLYGVHFGEAGVGKILIDGDLMNKSSSQSNMDAGFVYILAHEIGHVMTVDEHADDGVFARLRWDGKSSSAVSTDFYDKLRLMCSGKNANTNDPGKQLIKKEWDMVEAWLKQNKIGELIE